MADTALLSRVDALELVSEVLATRPDATHIHFSVVPAAHGGLVLWAAFIVPRPAGYDTQGRHGTDHISMLGAWDPTTRQAVFASLWDGEDRRASFQVDAGGVISPSPHPWPDR